MSPWEHRATAAAQVPAIDREARVLAFECIGPTSFCTTCVERCPVEGALRMVAGRPEVDTTLCNGCAACEEACPAPRKAIVVIPRLGGTNGRRG